MKIAVVAYEMEGARTGVGRYLEGLLSGVAQCDTSWRWLLFFKGEPFAHPFWTSDRTAAEPRFEPTFDRRPEARPILWEQLRLPHLLRAAAPDFVFSPAYSLPPIGEVPAMLTVHDLSFEHLPDEFPWKELWRRRLLARRAVRQARRVLADTHTIARDLSDTYGLDRAKVGVVPLGLDPGFIAAGAAEQPAEEDVLLETCGVQRPYLLYLGTVLARRRPDLVIEAFSAAAAEDPDLHLVLAGRNRLRQPGDLQRWIAGSPAADRVLEIGYIPEDVLLPLYRHARLSFYLSDYEGFGLPPFESLAAGTPVIVGPGMALDDLWPDYPYRCTVLDRETVVETIRQALGHPEARATTVRQARWYLAHLDWKRSAEMFLGEIDRALGA